MGGQVDAAGLVFGGQRQFPFVPSNSPISTRFTVVIQPLLYYRVVSIGGTPESGVPLFNTNSIVYLKLSGSILVDKGSTSRDSYDPAVFYTHR